MELLQGIDGIAFVELSTEDVVRHRLVKEIIKAYNKADEIARAKRENYLNKEKKEIKDATEEEVKEKIE